MNCQRCKANEAEYLVYTDTINLKVCIFCAITAKEVGITPEVLHGLQPDHQPGDTKKSLDPFYSAA
jgi:hypothetical protein